MLASARAAADAAGAVVAARCTSRPAVVMLDARAGVRGVDEAAAADVQADVAEAVEEDEVARPERRARDAAPERRTGRTSCAAASRPKWPKT